MNWEIDFELIPADNDDKRRAKLKARGDAGWEPYAIVGITHYFKRPKDDKKVEDKSKKK